MAYNLWKKSQKGFDGLSRRERILSWATLTVIWIVGWYHFVWMPFSLRLTGVEHQLLRLLQHPVAVQGVTDSGHISARLGQLVPPEGMVDLVDRLMDVKGGLVLLGLEAQPAHLLLHCERGLGHYGSGSVFRYDLKLSLEGDYPSILNYFHRIGSAPWKIQTDYVEFKVTTSSQAIVLLHLHFLSLSHSLLAQVSGPQGEHSPSKVELHK